MSLIKSDDFSAANEGWELNWLTGWTKHATYNVTMYILEASKKVAAYANHGCYYWGTLPASADQRIASDFAIGDYGTEAGKAVYVAGRIDSSSDTLYRAGRVDGYWKIEKVVNGTVTSIGTPVQNYVHNVTQRATLEIKTVGGNVELKLYRDAEVSPIVSGTDSSSPITANGYVGLQELSGSLLRLDNFYAETIDAGGASTTISTTIANITASVGCSTVGTFQTTITATLGNIVGSITSTGNTTNGTFTSEVLKDYAGNVLSNTALNFVRFYNDSTGALVLSKTGVSTNASGIVTFSDAALVAGATYRVDWETAAGSRRMPRKAAS